MALLETLNDKSWAAMDWLWDRGVPIGGVFEKYNLPAILFPLMIILLILVVFWALAPAAIADACGDKVCDDIIGESCETCPEDCGSCVTVPTGETLILTVELTGSVSDSLTLTLFDKDGSIIGVESGRKALFEFTDIQPQSIKATVHCQNGKAQTSRPMNIDKDNNLITLAVPEGCFELLTDYDNNALETHGNVVVQVFDDVTGNPLGATVTAMRGSDNLPEDSQFITAETTLNLRSDRFYYIIVTKPGYVSYNGEDDSFYMIAGDTVYRNIRLSPMGSTADSTLRVCATTATGSLREGRLSVMEVGGSEVASAQLSPVDAGCITFDVPSGSPLRATATSLPVGCISPGFSNSITVSPGSQEDISLSVSCDGDIAYVKVKVMDRDGNILTDDVIITVWNAISKSQLPGTAPDSSLSVGSGGYTEEVTIPAETLIQAKATSPPLGFIDTVSGPAAFSPNEHGKIDIVIGESSRGRFTFQGASIIYTPATPGSPVQVFVERIVFNDTELTAENSEVSVLINGERYDATYS